ncbi:hypothetical protein [Paraflavitalea sp. CAU 1676]|uniref:hypothetical protein n=1 Tax=Paraflavitalea sp. CAU 1676 TaxID=3032598 RepID=UPI0023DB3A36|nr:hypothetical protein [Paraflavitalea sp. CAU 1676]MDF2186928.1 hypothetical protein [Paraflavitalea sp. CAU 1676]
MYKQVLFRWIPLLCLVLVIVASVSLGQKHSKLVHKNNSLILQNDSILSVNLQLSKQLSKLQCVVDSLRMKSASASRLRIPN